MENFIIIVHGNLQKLQEILSQKEEESLGAGSSNSTSLNNPDICALDELSNATADSLQVNMYTLLQ